MTQEQTDAAGDWRTLKVGLYQPVYHGRVTEWDTEDGEPRLPCYVLTAGDVRVIMRVPDIENLHHLVGALKATLIGVQVQTRNKECGI